MSHICLGIICLLLALPLLSFSAPKPEYRWIQITMNAPFAPRDGGGAVVYDNKMWLLGGWNPGDKQFFPRICNNEVWSSANGLEWTLVKPNTFLDQSFRDDRDWEGRHTAGYVVFKNRMWIVGGDPIQHHYQNDVWNSSDGVHWTAVTRKVPWGPRVLQCTFVFGDYIWVMGGQTLPPYAPGPEKFYNDVWRSADGEHWEKVLDAAPWQPRGLIGGHIVHRGRMWICGGGTYDTPGRPKRTVFNDVWSSADGIHWERNLEHAPWDAREYHDVATFDDKMWVMEGWNPTDYNHNDVWYSADGVNWKELPNTPWMKRHAASVFVHQDALWMVAGNNMRSDVWKLVRTSGETEAAAPR